MELSFPPDTMSRLNEIADKQNRSNVDIVSDAVEAYLDSLEWLENEIKLGDDDFEAGRVISHEDIIEQYRKLGVDVDQVG
jgi:predicted transcriptional regulator